ncbi:energy transducer TonB [Synechococcus moorigangaii CMS01]|nr:energy transducer TonB [Synechococcus moorigangaii CMS01]
MGTGGIGKLAMIVLAPVLAASWQADIAYAIPPSVMEPYRAYMAAIESDNPASATSHAEAAYQAGVAARIDADTLAALAENRAQIYYDLEDYAAAAPAWDDLHALAPDTDTLALAASAYLLAGDRMSAAARARSLQVSSSRISEDLRFFTGYIIAVHEGPGQYLAQTGNEIRGGDDHAPAILREILDEGDRAVRSRQRERVILLSGLAAGVARGTGMDEAVTGHLAAWYRSALIGLRNRRALQELLENSYLVKLLLRQGYFPAIAPEEAEFCDESLIERFPPQYPVRALERGVEGHTVLTFDLGTDGHPENIEVVFATPDGNTFSRESVRALERWRYTPPVEDGEPFRRECVETTFSFFLDN